MGDIIMDRILGMGLGMGMGMGLGDTHRQHCRGKESTYGKCYQIAGILKSNMKSEPSTVVVLSTNRRQQTENGIIHIIEHFPLHGETTLSAKKYANTCPRIEAIREKDIGESNYVIRPMMIFYNIGQEWADSKKVVDKQQRQ